MINCASCGNESADEAAFCGFCGSKLKSEGPKKTLFAFPGITKDDLSKGALSLKSKAETEPEGGQTLAEVAPVEKTKDAEPAKKADEPKPKKRESKVSFAGLDSSWSLDLGGDKSTKDTGSILTGESTAPSLGLKTLQTPKITVDDSHEATIDDLESARQEAVSNQVALDKTDVIEDKLDFAALVGNGDLTLDPASLEPDPMASAVTAPSQIPDLAESPKAEKKKPEPEPEPARKKPSVGEAQLKSGAHVAPPEKKVVAAGAKTATNYPAPVSATPTKKKKGTKSKEDEESFFGASLSQYGMAPVAKTEDLDESVARGFKEAKTKSLVTMLVGVLVFLLLIGAIVFLMSKGE